MITHGICSVRGRADVAVRWVAEAVVLGGGRSSGGAVARWRDGAWSGETERVACGQADGARGTGAGPVLPPPALAP